MTTEQLRSGEKARKRHGVTFYASRPEIRDLAVVIKRFPGAPGAASRSFVLVHGIGVSSRYFHPLAAALATSGEVWLIDLPGYGAAPDPRQDVSIAEHARVLGEFLSGAQIENPVLVGHSMGCQVVSRLAVEFPDVSDRLVLMAPTVDPEHRSFRSQAARLGLDFTREPLRANLVVLTDYAFRCGPPYFFKQLRHLLADRIEERLPQITAPTLVLRGDRDPIVTREWAQRAATMLPRGTYAEVEGPHIVMYSDPAHTAEQIVRHATS